MDKGNIVAIIRGVEADHVCDIAQVLLEEGIRDIEVSLSDELNGLQSIKNLSKEFGAVLGLGAGTVISKRQVDLVKEAGAKYILTPGWDRDLVRYMLSQSITVYPGVFTPGEVMQAVSEGLTTLKLFPAGIMDFSYIKSLFGPFPQVNFMGVGGVTLNNIKNYYEHGCHSFAIGSDLVHRGATTSKADLDRIREQANVYSRILKVGVE